MDLIAHRITTLRRELRPLLEFLTNSEHARRSGDPNIADFVYGNPQEMPLPEYVAALLIHALEWVSEARVAPVAVRFQHAAGCDRADYERALRCAVEPPASAFTEDDLDQAEKALEDVAPEVATQAQAACPDCGRPATVHLDPYRFLGAAGVPSFRHSTGRLLCRRRHAE